MSVTTTTASQYSQCLFYHVKLNPADGTPILTTMQAYHYNKISDPCTTAWLPPYQMSVPSGKQRCFPDNGLRYYYKVSKITGKVLANSMFTSTHQVPRCDGQNNVLEYIVHS